MSKIRSMLLAAASAALLGGCANVMEAIRKGEIDLP